MAALSRFSEDVSKEELNALIQKAIPEKTKNSKKKMWPKERKKKNLKYQSDSFTRRIVAGVSSLAISIGCLNKFTNWLSKKVLLFFCFFFKDF